jgi:tellurite methyltransferase
VQQVVVISSACVKKFNANIGPTTVTFQVLTLFTRRKMLLVTNERISWDDRYREGSHRSLDPDPFLVESYDEFIEPIFPHGGTALDLAGGVGRHAIWLAQHGWTVILTDISEVGIALARENAGELADKIEFQMQDASTFTAGKQRYDLIAVFFYLQRKIFPELLKALRPGGLLLYKTYTCLHPKFGRGPTHPMHLLEANELLQAFPGLTVLHYHETVRDRGVAEFVGRKLE